MKNRAKKIPISIAPMMDYTDRHYRYFIRLLTKKTLLYTEMVNVNAILNGDRDRFLKYNSSEHPLVLQLGGDNAESMAECAFIAEDLGYDEVNINAGCPSDRVLKGSFGACLMANPKLVANMISKMRERVKIPISVKHRIGFTSPKEKIDYSSYQELKNFVSIVAESGCDRFIVHARSAILGGLSPKENRNVPPLDYSLVHQLKSEFSDLIIEINGGFRTHKQVSAQLNLTDGVMIGRAAYEDPMLFQNVDSTFFNSKDQNLTRKQILKNMIEYVDNNIDDHTNSHSIIRHLYGLMHGQPGAKLFRRTLTEQCREHKKDSTALRKAIELISFSD